MTDDESYQLEHETLSDGGLEPDFGSFAIRDHEITVDDYDEAAALVEQFDYVGWANGDPEPEREPEPVARPDPEIAEFDPKEDEPRSSTRTEITAVYNKLRKEGFEQEAEQIRYPDQFTCGECDGEGCTACGSTGSVPQGGSRQHKIARRLSKRYLDGFNPGGRLRW